MNELTIVFLFMLALATMLQLWLGWRHISHVRQHRESVPEPFAQKITLSQHHKAADYTLAKTRLHQWEIAVGALLLLFWTLGGGLEWVDQQLKDYALGELSYGTLFMFSVFLLMAVLDLPFTLYRTFSLEKRFGFNRTTPGLFVGDLLKNLIVAIILGLPLLWTILWLMQEAGHYWWLYAWGVWFGFSLLMMWAYPAFIAPLFNKFNPLENQQLKQRIQALLQRCGFVSNGIFVMDGSKRSSHGNAYFTGLGSNKRIVFFDTLLNSLTTEQVEAVLAHELGHFKHRHIHKRLLTMAAITLLGFALLGWLMQQDWFYQGLGMSSPSHHAALMLFVLVSPVFSFFLAPVSSLLSRKHEFEADSYAAEQTNAQDLIDALVKLYKDNAATLTPDPMHSAYYDSHPPAALRVAHLAKALR